ncbi:MAG: DinB family protein [Chitinophagaceae bacterium]
MPLSSSVLVRLKHQHETLNELIKGLSAEQLKETVNPGKWSAFQNMVHLAAYQPTFFTRLQVIAAHDNPLFERYVADNDPVFHQYMDYSLPAILDDINTQRFLINNYLTQLPETMLRRRGTHPVYGRFSSSQWADFFLLHEAHHLFTIFMLTAGLRTNLQQ